MGLPGGNKEEGIRQLQIAINGGGLTSVEARFYLAKNLRTFDEQYERAATIVEPLTLKYPHNPIFLLLLGNLNGKLGRNEKAAVSLRAARNLTPVDPACAVHVQQAAIALLSTLH